MPPEPFSFADSGRVEILVPSQVDVAEGYLYWLGPEAVDWERSELLREGAGVRGMRTPRSTDNLAQFIAGADEAITYYGIIPPQHRSGTLRYYLEIRTEDNLVFGGRTTVQEVTITRRGMLDHLVLASTRSNPSAAQVGVPMKMTIAAYDDAENDLTPLLPAEAFVWAQLDSIRGELQVSPDDPTEAIYLPTAVGPVRVGITVRQEETDVTVMAVDSWTNRRQLLDRLLVTAPREKIETGDSIRFEVTAYDTSDVPMEILPIWEIDNPLLGEIEPIPFSHQAWFRSVPGRIGYVEVAVRDSLTGKVGRFNTGLSGNTTQGLSIYGLIRSGVVDTTTFEDGAGFRVKIPPRSLGAGSEIGLIRQSLPSVMRLTPRYETAELGYDITVESSGEVELEQRYLIALPIADGAPVTEPLVGVWDDVTIAWNVTEGWFIEDTSGVEIEVDELSGLFTILSASQPLGIENLKFNPNPFSPDAGGVSIEFRLNSDIADYLTLDVGIYNMRGDRIRKLVDGEPRPKGDYRREAPEEARRIIWDGRTDDGRDARNGRYIVVITAKDAGGEDRQVGSVVLIK